MEIGLALRPDWLGLRPAWLALGPSRGGHTYGHTDVCTYGWTENLPILQDFVPYRGCCPKKKMGVKTNNGLDFGTIKDGFESNSVLHFIGE